MDLFPVPMRLSASGTCKHVLSPLARACLLGAALAGCTSGTGGGTPSDPAALLRSGPLIFIGAQLHIYDSPSWHDFNSDGHDDVLSIAGPPSGMPPLYLARSSEADILGDQTQIGTGTPFAAGDFNGDGRADVAVQIVAETRGGQRTDVGLLFQRPDGTFDDPVLLEVENNFGGFAAIVAGNFAGDESQDFVVAAVDPSIGTLLFTGLGGGAFSEPTAVNTPVFQGGRLIAVDVDLDGFDDLLFRDVTVANFAIVLIRSRGDGTFDTPKILLDQFARTEPDDYNGDGFPDFVSVLPPDQNGRSTIRVHFGDAAADYTQSVDSIIPIVDATFFGVILSGDFNGDGRLDVVIQGADSVLPAVGPRMDYIALGNGDGRFRVPVPIPLPPAQRAQDFDRDGHLDLLGFTDGTTLFPILFGNGDGSFREFEPPHLSGVPNATFAATGDVRAPDIDGDGHADVLVYNAVEFSDFEVHYGNGDGTFESGGSLGGALPSTPIDLDFDGDLDFWALNHLGRYLTIWRTYTRGDVRPLPRIDLVPHAFAKVAFADLDRDGLMDIVAASNGMIGVLWGLGDLRFEPLVSLGSDFEADALWLADVTGDGRLDLLGSDGGQTSAVRLVVKPAIGDRSFGTGIETETMAGFLVSRGIAEIGDFNNDGRSDVAFAVRESPSGPDVGLHVYLGNKDATFSLGHAFQLSSTGTIVLRPADADADGDTDIVCFLLNFDRPQVAAVFVNDGSTGLSLSQVSPIHYTVSDLEDAVFDGWVVDVSGEGIPDIVFISRISGMSLSLGQGDGTFAPPYHFAVGSEPEIVVGDFDEDGDNDIVTVTRSNDLNYLENFSVN